MKAHIPKACRSRAFLTSQSFAQAACAACPCRAACDTAEPLPAKRAGLPGRAMLVMIEILAAASILALAGLFTIKSLS